MQHDRLDEWAEWMAAVGSSPKTVRTRVQGIEGLARHAGLDDPARISTRQIVSWLAVDRAAWTRLTYWYSVQAWGAWLVARGYRPADPAAPIPRPASPKSVPRPVPDACIDRMLTDPVSGRAYAYTTLAVFAGLRVHEIAKFKGEDIMGAWLYVHGKGGSDAAIPVHPRIQRLAAGMPKVGFWFPGADGGHVRPRSVTLTLSSALRAAGCVASAHALRHSYGTRLLRGSRNLRTVQALMRHKSVGATERYTQVADRDQIEAIAHLTWGDAA